MAIIQYEANSYQEFSYNGQNGYDGSVEEFTVPFNGIYKLEVWGACGGFYDNDTSKLLTEEANYSGFVPGRKYRKPMGGYSVGYKQLRAGQKIYIACGGWPGHRGWTGDITSDLAITHGGYNGGGNGSLYGSTYYSGSPSLGGGGATHIAFESGLLSSFSNKKDKVLIVAGGGGGSCIAQQHSAWHYEYINDDPWRAYTVYDAEGQAQCMSRGGGETSDNACGMYTYGPSGFTDFQVPAATQSYYMFGQGEHEGCCHNVDDSRFPGAYWTSHGGGGGGWYGGRNNTDGNNSQQSWRCNGSGGSGYIGGVPQFTYRGVTYTPSMTIGGNDQYNGHAKISWIANCMPGVKFINLRVGETNYTEIDRLFFQDLRTQSADKTRYEITDVYFRTSKNGEYAHMS